MKQQSPEQFMQEVRRRCKEVREAYYFEASADTSVSQTTHRELAIAILRYRDALYEHRHELENHEFPDISPIRKRLGEQTESTKESPGLRRGTTTQKSPAIIEISIEDLLATAERLDDIAHELGFTTDQSSQ